MITSGCANSLEDEGTSFPRNGTASLSRVLGMSGSFKAFHNLSCSTIRTRRDWSSSCSVERASKASQGEIQQLLAQKRRWPWPSRRAWHVRDVRSLPSVQMCRCLMFWSHHLHHQSKRELCGYSKLIYRQFRRFSTTTSAQQDLLQLLHTRFGTKSNFSRTERNSLKALLWFFSIMLSCSSRSRSTSWSSWFSLSNILILVHKSNILWWIGRLFSARRALVPVFE